MLKRFRFCASILSYRPHGSRTSVPEASDAERRSPDRSDTRIADQLAEAVRLEPENKGLRDRYHGVMKRTGRPIPER